MPEYPDGHHHTCFIRTELIALGADFKWDDPRVEETEGPFSVNGVAVSWMLDNRIPGNRDRQDPAARRMLQRGDVLVCHAQKGDALRVGGYWLPLAATPRWASVKDRTPVCKTAFVGYLHDDRRRVFIERVQALLEGDMVVANGVFYEEAAAIYQGAHTGLNVPSHVSTEFSYDVNMRTFEIMASGVPLVTYDNPDLRDLGIMDGVHCLTFKSPEEAAHRVRFLVEHPHIAGVMAANAERLVTTEHTYKKRAEQLLGWVQEYTQWQSETTRP